MPTLNEIWNSAPTQNKTEPITTIPKSVSSSTSSSKSLSEIWNSPSKISIKTPTSSVIEQRTSLQAQGKSLSVNPNKAAPSMAGEMLRGLLRKPANVFQSLQAIVETVTTNKSQAQIVKDAEEYNPYLGTIHAVGRPVGSDGDINTVKEFLESVGDSVATGLEIGSNISGGSAVKTTIKTGVAAIKNVVQNSIKQLIKEGATRTAKEGAVAGGTFALGNSLNKGLTPEEIAKEVMKGILFGAGGGAILGVGGVLVGKGISNAASKFFKPKQLEHLQNIHNTETIKPEYNAGSQKTVEAFSKSTSQKSVGKFELGTFGKNSETNKTGNVDRFPSSELEETQKHITDSYKASDNPKSYRSDNIAHISEMPNGQKRVIYTRKNANGKEEILNWHTVSDPKYIEQLKSFGVPDQSRTGILSLERSGSSPLTYGGNKSIPNTTEKSTNIKNDVGEQALNTRAEKLQKAAVEKKLTETLGELPTHEKMSMAEQASKSVDFIEKNPEEALKVARGEAQPPQGILPESVYTALEIKAIREGDVELLQKLSKSEVPTEAGQRMKALDSDDVNSPVKIMRDLNKAKETKFEKKHNTTVKKAKTKIVSELKTEIKQASKRQSWESFIKDVTCKV